MTDDKGAGEGPYRVIQPVDMTPLTVEGPTGNHGHTLHNGALCNVLNAAFAEGRKAERERCLAIIKTHNCWIHPSLKQISREIGGQDAK